MLGFHQSPCYCPLVATNFIFRFLLWYALFTVQCLILLHCCYLGNCKVVFCLVVPASIHPYYLCYNNISVVSMYQGWKICFEKQRLLGLKKTFNTLTVQFLGF